MPEETKVKEGTRPKRKRARPVAIAVPARAAQMPPEEEIVVPVDDKAAEGSIEKSTPKVKEARADDPWCGFTPDDIHFLVTYRLDGKPTNLMVRADKLSASTGIGHEDAGCMGAVMGRLLKKMRQ